MESEDEFIKRERQRSDRIVISIYAVMALIFALTALVVANFHLSLGMTSPTALFIAKSFALLATGNVILTEVWQHVFAFRD